MSVTTIKVDTALRDRIGAAASTRTDHRWYLDQIVKDARRRERLQAMANAMHANPPGPDYWAEVAEIDSLSAAVRD